MADINDVTIKGNLVRDADLRTTRSGTAVANFTVAVNEPFKRGDELVDNTEFIKVTVWGVIAQKAGELGVKGARVRAEGKLRSNRWEDKDGNKRVDWGVTADKVRWYDDAPKDQRDDDYGRDAGKENGYAPQGEDDEIPF